MKTEHHKAAHLAHRSYLMETEGLTEEQAEEWIERSGISRVVIAQDAMGRAVREAAERYVEAVSRFLTKVGQRLSS